MKKQKRTLVIDINYLPSEYKDSNIKRIKKLLEKEYGCRVILIDGSRQNTQGMQNLNQPVYFI